jgi:hypothetical protein
MKRKNKRVNWTQNSPTEQAYYWHWSGNPDDAPFIAIHNLPSRWCEDIGGWWLKIPPPELPEVRD